MKGQTISAMYIVRNEEEFLPFSIRSIYDSVDEIIVVDNGSTDRTIDIVRSFDKTKLFHCNERGDFAKLRNIALQHASGDWLIKLDADEVFYPDLSNILPALISKPNMDAYTCWFYHLVSDFWHMQNTSDHDPRYHRIFLIKNNDHLLWKNPVHEYLEGIGGRIANSGLHYVHYGFTKKLSLIAEKIKYYADLEGKPDPLNGQKIDGIFDGVPLKPFTKPHPKVIESYIISKKA